jgi:hypothetical protein
MFRIKEVILQTYFMLGGIFESSTYISFQFDLNTVNFQSKFEIRGLRIAHKILGFPMQGLIYVNDCKEPIYEFKPQPRQHRKPRKEQYISIPPRLLKPGRNFVKYRLPCLDKSYCLKYKYDEKTPFYLSINQVVELTKEQVIQETFNKRRLTKQDSVAFLRKTLAVGEVEVTDIKLLLVCPYTSQRIRVPVRGRYCKHFTCFCL